MQLYNDGDLLGFARKAIAVNEKSELGIGDGVMQTECVFVSLTNFLRFPEN